MIVRFNSRALQDTVERRADPIGVEGDPACAVKGGVSETEAIIGAARKSMPPPAEVEKAEKEGTDLSKIDSDMIVEEEQAEPGPELDPEGLSKAKEKAKEGKEKEGVKTEEGGSGGTGE